MNHDGHTLGAAGIIEAIISLIAIEESFMPGSLNTKNIDPAIKIRYLLENRTAPVRYVMSNSFGFGGTNCSVILGSIH